MIKNNLICIEIGTVHINMSNNSPSKIVLSTKEKLRNKASDLYRVGNYAESMEYYNVIITQKNYNISDIKNFLYTFNKYAEKNNLTPDQLNQPIKNTLSLVCSILKNPEVIYRSQKDIQLVNKIENWCETPALPYNI